MPTYLVEKVNHIGRSTFDGTDRQHHVRQIKNVRIPYDH